MYLVRVMPILLVVISGIRESHTALGELIEKIHQVIDVNTAYLVDVDEEHFGELVKPGFEIPLVVVTLQSDLSELDIVNRNTILVVQVDENRANSLLLVKLVRAMEVRMFVIIIAESLNVLEDYFLKFWERSFTRIFGVIGDIQFAYLPYADSSIHQLLTEDPFPDALRDLNGYSFRTTLQTDFPRAFWYRNQQGLPAVGGFVGKLFLSFITKHNATFTEVFINNSSLLFIPGVINATIQGDIDISMNTYSETEGLQLSYPIKFLSWAIMVPLNGYLDPNEYFLRPFSSMVWIFIGITLGYVVLIHALKDYYANEPIKLWLYFSQTLLFLMAVPYGRPITTAYRIHLQVLVLAFILVNLYNIYLTSFLTVFIKVKQYSTIKELIENDIPVMMVNYEWESIEDPELHPVDFDKIVRLVDNAVYIKERNSMRNTSFAYAAGMDKAEFLLGIQMRYTKATFHIIDDSLSEYYLGFLLPIHSPFEDILNTHILQVFDAGLMQKWESDAVVQGGIAGLIEVMHTSDVLLVPLNWQHLQFAWSCLGAGMTAATIVFLCEYYRKIVTFVE